MPEKRADVFLNWMGLIDSYTLERARKDLSQDELDFEPHPGAWGIRRRGEQRTKHIWSEGNGEWVVECDWDLATDEFEGRPVVMPMTTINWLLNHFGAAPGLFAQLEIVGGRTTPTQEVYNRMWSHTVIPTVAEGLARFDDGWAALKEALESTTDEMLEREYPGHPWRRGDHALAALLNEVSHHGTQICMVRDIYANRYGRTRQR
ncbi:MAG TPA: DinB family protein [Mycobacteriales bacterium]|nr:DinB family protein [Mycobacteriales bacterium]